MKAFYHFTCLVLLLTAYSAHAAVVEYNLTSLGDNSYQYDYTISNDGSLGPGVDIKWFAILFDPALYDENTLTIATPEPLNSDWDQLILGSGLLIPAAYDVFARSSGIVEGTPLAGFAVQFDWLGAGLPGSQAFEVYDGITGDLIDQGATVVPLPGALVLFLTAFLGIGALNGKRRLIA